MLFDYSNKDMKNWLIIRLKHTYDHKLPPEHGCNEPVIGKNHHHIVVNTSIYLFILDFNIISGCIYHLFKTLTVSEAPYCSGHYAEFTAHASA